MRRFIFLTFLGGIATLAGHGVVSLGLHPYRLDSLAPLLQGCAVLVFGTAMFGSGSRWSTRDKRALLAGILWHRHGSGAGDDGYSGLYRSLAADVLDAVHIWSLFWDRCLGRVCRCPVDTRHVPLELGPRRHGHVESTSIPTPESPPPGACPQVPPAPSRPRNIVSRPHCHSPQ